MLIAAIVVVFAAITVLAGLTGIGVYDSRDTSYSLGSPQSTQRSSDENQVTPQHRRPVAAAILGRLGR
jgi:hypothetical protein